MLNPNAAAGAPANKPVVERGWWARLFVAGAVVGVLDGLFAVVLFVVILKAATTTRVAQSIAGALLGRDAAFRGGAPTAVLGTLMHFSVAYAWSAVYFVALSRSARLARLIRGRRNTVLGGLAFGMLVWLVMDGVVVPLSQARHTPVSSPIFWIELVGHALLVGLPIALIASPDGASGRARDQI